MGLPDNVGKVSPSRTVAKEKDALISMESTNQFAKHWKFAEGLTFLNHGSFGAAPTVVLKAQREFQDQLESDPIAFLAPERSLEPKLDYVRQCLAELLGASFDRLAFVRNATDGVNAVLRSFPWNEGDQIVVTSHGYNACTNAAKFVGSQFGVEVVSADVPFPLANETQVVEAIEHAITAKTRLLLIDHVTSPTGLVFPIQAIIELAHRKGVRILIDGAHAPGMLPLRLDRLGADYYTANHHKWLCGPKVSGFLYVAPQWQEEVRPTVISHAANRPRPNRSRFLAEFDWTGTFDPTPLLALPTAIEFLSQLYSGGLDQLMQQNREKALAGRRMILDRLAIDSPAPESMIGSLGAVLLTSSRFRRERLELLKSHLYDDYRIELPVFQSPIGPDSGDWILRISMQVYNELSQIEKLLDAVQSILNG